MAMSVNQVFAEYDRRLHLRMAAMDCPEPGTAEGNAEIKRRLNKVLGIRDEWVPEIRETLLTRTQRGQVTVDSLSFRSWDNFYGMATLYCPPNPAGAVLLNPGHSSQSKYGASYQRMAQVLAEGGVAVLVTDVIGSGERTPLGHRDVIEPFACGTTVAGLIILEAAGWLDWLVKKFPGIPVGTTGNSGGGQAIILLAAFCPEKIAFAVPSGFPHTFEFKSRKERHLCGCSIMPGIAGTLEMYHCLGCLCPKPLMVASGNGDPLIPRDEVIRLGNRLRRLYGDKGNFEVSIPEGFHSWDLPRFQIIPNYIFRLLGLPAIKLEALPETYFPETHSSWQLPEDAIDINVLASRLTGKPLSGKKHLWEVFPPELPVDGMTEEERYIITQLEHFIK